MYPKEQTDLFSALIGIMHVGNLNFQSNDEGYATFIESEDSKFTLTAITVKIFTLNLIPTDEISTNQ